MPARRNEAGDLHDAKGSLNNPDLGQPVQARRRFADPRPATTIDGRDRPESQAAGVRHVRIVSQRATAIVANRNIGSQAPSVGVRSALPPRYCPKNVTA